MIDETLEKKMGLAVNYGALVVRESENDAAVVPGSPAAQAGIREKDIVLVINGKKLDADHPIQDLLEDLEVGDRVTFAVLRNGKQFTTEATLTERK